MHALCMSAIENKISFYSGNMSYITRSDYNTLQDLKQLTVSILLQFEFWFSSMIYWQQIYTYVFMKFLSNSGAFIKYRKCGAHVCAMQYVVLFKYNRMTLKILMEI